MKINGSHALPAGGKRIFAISLIMSLVLAAVSASGAFAASSPKSTTPAPKTHTARVSRLQLRDVLADIAALVRSENHTKVMSASDKDKSKSVSASDKSKMDDHKSTSVSDKGDKTSASISDKSKADDKTSVHSSDKDSNKSVSRSDMDHQQSAKSSATDDKQSTSSSKTSEAESRNSIRISATNNQLFNELAFALAHARAFFGNRTATGISEVNKAERSNSAKSSDTRQDRQLLRDLAFISGRAEGFFSNHNAAAATNQSNNVNSSTSNFNSLLNLSQNQFRTSQRNLSMLLSELLEKFFTMTSGMGR